ncbi:hypothetical protein HPB48_010041 [Haemaphysalis longicornis]|uniref:THAP-type domain-containing protein n=1 Tax=Haemaphysalis longicornis TaxID=44386 RepID=A0A9J6F9E5_HAELO|nr:hypothetical protein HPB48_010041 [Haemaphysalis longicornis]
MVRPLQCLAPTPSVPLGLGNMYPSDYKTCTEKVSIFAAPGEADSPKIWRLAIPRKDRVLQSTDYECEKHFEPRLGNATSFEELSPTETSRACDVVSEMDQRAGVGSAATVFYSTPVMVSATDQIEDVF